MEKKLWHGSRWPQKVPKEITGYHKPLYSFLDDSAKAFPDLTYTIFQGAARTYRQTKDAADRIANFLAQRGVRKGDRAALFLPNSPHFPPVFFGILKSGAACVTCNPMYKASELHYQLKDSGAKALFVLDHPDFYATAVKAIEGTQVDTVVVCNLKNWLPPLKGFWGGLLGKIPKAKSYQPGHVQLDEVLKTAKPEAPRIDIDPDNDLCLIIYTGGTTGVPKGAALVHSSLVHDAMVTDEWMLFPDDKGEMQKPAHGGTNTYLGVLPWYHSFGLTLVLMVCTLQGNRVVCIPDPRAGNPPFTEVLEAVQKYKVTFLTAVPTIYSAFVNHPLLSKYDLTSIIGCGSGGAPIPVEVLKQFEAKTGAIIFEGYGLSETSPVITVNPSNKEQRKVGSVGVPLPNTDIKIVDLEDGTKELPQGEDGEICVNGPMVMQGYWQKPEANDQVFRMIDGKRFFLTGDIGHLDEDGFVVITDRKKDLILVGGFNAYPREIEEVLYEHPAVAQAAVVGVPDPHSGEKVKAFIQLKPGVQATEKDIIDFCKDRLAGYKRPREIEFRDELPTSTVGKVLRRVLRDEERAKARQG